MCSDVNFETIIRKFARIKINHNSRATRVRHVSLVFHYYYQLLLLLLLLLEYNTNASGADDNTRTGNRANKH